MNKNLCGSCGMDLLAEAEMFSKDKLFFGHNCRGQLSSQEVFNVLDLLKRHGFPCFQVDGVTTTELDDVIQGWG